jgi:hypothetical protein
MKIYKYPLRPVEVQSVSMHPGEILHVGEQNNHACLWALVDTDAPMEERKFAVVPTGDFCPYTPDRYLGTVKIYGGSLIYHIFEVTE